MDTNQLMQKVAQVAPEKYNFIVKTAAEVSASPFRDEIVENLDKVIKKANAMPSMGARFGNAAAGVGAAVATGLVYSLAGDAVDALKRGITKTRNYKAMMQANPELKNFAAEDVQRTFSVIHRFNPEFSSEPTVAGSMVRRQLQMAGNGSEFDPKTLTDMVNSRQALNNVKKLPMPGNLPWEPLEQKKLKGLQGQQMEQQLAFGKNQEGRQAEEHARKGEQHGERGQRQTAREVDPILRRKTQLEIQRLENQLAEEAAKTNEGATSGTPGGVAGGAGLSARMRDRFIYGGTGGKGKK